MSRLLPPLEALSQQHPDEVVQELASNLGAVIATHGAYRPENLAAPGGSRNPEETAKKSKTKSDAKNPQHLCPTGGGGGFSSDGPDLIKKPLSDWLLEACDPDVPTRAVALRVLTQMVQRREPEAVRAQEKLLTVCRHPTDSFVFTMFTSQSFGL